MEEWIKFLKMLGGCSVTQRIKQIKQPRGGYLPPKKFTAVLLGEGMDALNPNEYISYFGRTGCRLYDSISVRYIG